MLHPEILTKEQHDLLPFLKKFGKHYNLVGGTAIALQLGHRRSIDFDLFTDKMFKGLLLERKVRRTVKIDEVIKNKESEFTFFAHNRVKITFFWFPYPVAYTEKFDKIIRMPDVLGVAAMKAFALGQRAKWKDYVDLYFVIRDHYSVNEIAAKGKEFFAGEFNPKLFRQQLSYHEDIDYREKVEFMPGFAVSEKKIKKALVEFSIS